MSNVISLDSETAEAKLNAAEHALRSGHFANARRLLAQVKDLEKSSANAPISTRRAALQARLAPDSMVFWLIGLCLLLFVFIVATTT